MKKYRILKDIPNFFKEGVALENIQWYKAGDIIQYNQWMEKYGKKNDTYHYRMITREFIDSHPEYFEELHE